MLLGGLDGLGGLGGVGRRVGRVRASLFGHVIVSCRELGLEGLEDLVDLPSGCGAEDQIGGVDLVDPGDDVVGTCDGKIGRDADVRGGLSVGCGLAELRQEVGYLAVDDV